ncbi:hypothetical protein HID58_086708 [Brassica napus]|uniref:Uncharacterized protein n=1 Tax=Brassica napus TaxID=3708 RepID=A0ABQ7XT33_BRANA|nr:hypothetical protein HID58_086708 [Brassica napus]
MLPLMWLLMVILTIMAGFSENVKMSSPESEAFRSSISPLENVIDSNTDHDPGLPPPLLLVTKTGSSIPEIEIVLNGSSTTISVPSSPKDCSQAGVPGKKIVLQSTDLSPVIVPPSELSSDPSATFVPSIGAWAKPLTFAHPATPPTPATPKDFDPQYLKKLLDSFWPTLTDRLGQNQKKRDHITTVREFPLIPVQKIPVSELKYDGTLRFPWAARMSPATRSPATRNLYRAAKPTFRLDGAPQVSIPSQVLSTPPHFPAHSLIATTQKDSSTVSHSSLDAKSIPAATLAGSSSAPTFHKIMDNVPSDIIISEGIKLSGNDPLTMTLHSSESNQELGDIESDFCITEQMDEFGSMTRSGRLVKSTQKYQGNEWFTVRGKGKRGRRGRSS